MPVKIFPVKDYAGVPWQCDFSIYNFWTPFYVVIPIISQPQVGKRVLEESVFMVINKVIISDEVDKGGGDVDTIEVIYNGIMGDFIHDGIIQDVDTCLLVIVDYVIGNSVIGG